MPPEGYGRVAEGLHNSGTLSPDRLPDPHPVPEAVRGRGVERVAVRESRRNPRPCTSEAPGTIALEDLPGAGTRDGSKR